MSNDFNFKTAHVLHKLFIRLPVPFTLRIRNLHIAMPKKTNGMCELFLSKWLRHDIFVRIKRTKR